MQYSLRELRWIYFGKGLSEGKTEEIETGNLIEDTPVSDHADPPWYRNMSNRATTKTTFYYVPTEPSSVCGFSAAFAKTILAALAVPAPDMGSGN